MPTSLLIVVVFVALFIGAVCYGRWWELHGGGKTSREKEARRKVARGASARARGWRYDGTVDGNIGFRISGETPGGTTWTIHYDSDHSSSSSTAKLVFNAQTLSSATYVWTIHDKKTYDITQKRVVRAIIGGISKLVGVFSDSLKLKRDFYLKAGVLAAGSREFRERYVLAATDSRWTALIDTEIERQFLNWPKFKQTMSLRDNCVCAELAPQGLRVLLYADAPEFDVIEHMAKLGQMLTDATVRIKAGIGISEPLAD